MRILRVRGRFRQAWRLVIFCSNAGCSMFAPPCQEYSHAYIPYGSIHTQIVFLLKHAAVLAKLCRSAVFLCWKHSHSKEIIEPGCSSVW